MLGKHQSEEHRRKTKERMIGNKFALGKHWKLSEKTKRKMSEAKKGEKSPTKRPEVRKKLSDFWKGKRIGKNNPMWKKRMANGGNYKIDNERNDSAYQEWRKGVWKRDNWKCRINNKDCNGKIKAHHILSWRDFPELRYNINNGITLCQAHHPLKRAEEKRLIPFFQGLMSVLNETI